VPGDTPTPEEIAMNPTMTGHCLCKAISLTMPTVTTVEVCHCGICRRWGGGPFMGISAADTPVVEGAEHIALYSSSRWAERAFCRHCGTHLYYHLKESNHYTLMAGLFQDVPGLVFKEEIFIDHKPDYYAFANPTEKLTQAQVFAKFGA
jgi:hypothetical protein